jgi:hypothetical protein
VALRGRLRGLLNHVRGGRGPGQGGGRGAAPEHEWAEEDMSDVVAAAPERGQTNSDKELAR